MEARKYLALCARLSGHSSSSRHSLTPMTKIRTGFLAKPFCTPLKRKSYHSSHFLFAEIGGDWAEIDIANVAAATRVAADDDQKALVLAGRFVAGVIAQSLIIAEGTALKDVVPGGYMQRRNLDIGKVIFNRPTLPIIVVVRMRQPVQEIRR